MENKLRLVTATAISTMMLMGVLTTGCEGAVINGRDSQPENYNIEIKSNDNARSPYYDLLELETYNGYKVKGINELESFDGSTKIIITLDKTVTTESK